jgi:hypothetical protein
MRVQGTRRFGPGAKPSQPGGSGPGHHQAATRSSNPHEFIEQLIQLFQAGRHFDRNREIDAAAAKREFVRAGLHGQVAPLSRRGHHAEREIEPHDRVAGDQGRRHLSIRAADVRNGQTLRLANPVPQQGGTQGKASRAGVVRRAVIVAGTGASLEMRLVVPCHSHRGQYAILPAWSVGVINAPPIRPRQPRQCGGFRPS